MTDFDPTDDDLVSAYLDDEVTTEEAAAVEARPELVALVEELRSLQESLRAPIPSTSSPAAMEDMIGVALGEFASSNGAEVHRFPSERSGAASAATEPPAASGKAASNNVSPSGRERPVQQSGVADLNAARERKNRRNVWLLSAAAAVLLAVAIPAALNNIRGGEDSSDATASSDVALETASIESDSDSADSAGGSSDAVTNAAGVAKSDETAQDAAAMINSAEATTAAATAPTITAAAAEAQALEAGSDSAADGYVDADAEEEEEDAAMEDEAAMADDAGGRAGALRFFASTPTVDDLLLNLEQPGFLEELEAVSQEFGAPMIECADVGETGGLAEFTATGQVVEIIIPMSDGDPPDSSPVRIVDRQTCAVLATFDR